MDNEMKEYLKNKLIRDIREDNSILSTQEIEYLKGIYGIYHIQFDKERKQNESIRKSVHLNTHVRS